jgi:hypothetical protein
LGHKKTWPRVNRGLIGLSRHPATPRRLVYELDPATGVFTTVGDPQAERFRDNWVYLRAVLAPRKSAATHHELLMDWTADREKPPASVLYEWLNRAAEDKLVRRQGTGRRNDPYRYRLPNADDAYRDRGELPPLRPLPPLLGGEQ